MIDLPSGKGTCWFVGILLLVIFMIAAFGAVLAVKNEVAFRENCEAKGGEAITIKSDMVCFNKKTLIKE